MSEAQPAPVAEPVDGGQLEELDVDAPLVGIVMGSKSDMEPMQRRPRRS